MSKPQTELLDFVINPSFLELIKQPLSKTSIPSALTFDIERAGKTYSVTVYGVGSKGQVNISSVDRHGWIGNTIIRDFCKTPEEFKKLFDKFDDLILRIP